jgi:DNA-binding GntR family transcriptional regulator
MNTMPRQYQRISETLKQQIAEGVYKPESLLPSENELSAQFSTSRMTVRQALSELVREGYIDRRHGKGSIVRLGRKSLGLLSFQGFSDSVGQEHTVRTAFLGQPRLTTWPADFFYELTAEEEKLNCLSINRIRFAEEQAIMLEYTWVPDIGLKSILTDGLLEGSLFRTLHSQHQFDIRNMDQRLRAVTATNEQAALLNCPRKSPLLHIDRCYHTNRLNLNIYSRLFCFTDHFAISGGL